MAPFPASILITEPEPQSTSLMQLKNHSCKITVISAGYRATRHIERSFVRSVIYGIFM